MTDPKTDMRYCGYAFRARRST